MKLPISPYQKNPTSFAIRILPLSARQFNAEATFLFLHGNPLDLETLCFSECEASWDMWKFSFYSSETFWPSQRLSHHELVCSGQIQNLGEFLLPFFFGKFERLMILSCNEIIYFCFLCCFYIIKKLRKVSSNA